MATEAANAERQAKAQLRVDAHVERIARSLNFAAPPRTRADTRDTRNANETERMATFLELVANHVDPNSAGHKASAQAPVELGGIGEYNEQEEQQRQAAERQRLERQAGGAADGGADESPLSDTNADEAIEAVGRMRSRDKLQQVVDSDPRATVKAAAQERLNELGQ
jgi:hypothetical protein